MGWLAGEIKVLVVRHRRQYYATNRLSLTARAVRELYTRRHEVEEVIKALKAHVRLEACQAGYKRSQSTAEPAQEGVQHHHVALCLVASLMLERERIDQGITLCQLKRQLLVRGLKSVLPSLAHVRKAA